MLFRLDARDDAGDLALRANDECRPLDPQVFSAIHTLFFEHAELLDDSFIRIGQQRKRQLIGIFEFLLGRGLVCGNAQHLGASAVYLLVCVAEPASLIGSAGGVGLGVEEQDQRPSAIILK